MLLSELFELVDKELVVSVLNANCFNFVTQHNQNNVLCDVGFMRLTN